MHNSWSNQIVNRIIPILKQCYFNNYSALSNKYSRVQILLSVHMTRFAYTQILRIRKMRFALGLRQVQIFQLFHTCKFCIRESMRTHGQICVRTQILHICKICIHMQIWSCVHGFSLKKLTAIMSKCIYKTTLFLNRICKCS